MKNIQFTSIFFFFLFVPGFASAQVLLEGYTFEENNRGFLQQVKITVYQLPDNIVRGETITDTLGYFSFRLSRGQYRLSAQKDVFFERQDTFELENQKKFLKLALKRKPGYLFDVSLADSRDNPDDIVEAITGATIEIYNRTLDRPEKILQNHPHAFFQYTFEPGNHYTMLIRKPGYLAKRIEVYVNIKGCILCVDGVRTLTPGVSENLTANNTMGTLIANIDLDKAKVNKRIQIQNIYYDYDKYDIRADATEQLDKVVTLMKDNPGLSVELGSHTDSRGNDKYNLDLSDKRAAAAVGYIISEGVDSQRITSKGYGETQLVNRCKNGVSCTETEHQANRRTELRITGVSSNALEYLQWPSLEKIIQDEKQALELKKAKNKKPVKNADDAALPAGTTPKDIPEAFPAPPPQQGPSLPYSSQKQTNTQKWIKIPDQYNGYLVEILKTNKETNKEHPLLQAQTTVYWNKDTTGNFYYYTGVDGGKTATFEFFRKKIKPTNEKARFVRFRAGEKTYLD